MVRGGWNPDTERDETVMLPTAIEGFVLPGASDQTYNEMLSKKVSQLLRTTQSSNSKRSNNGKTRLLEDLDDGNEDMQSDKEGNKEEDLTQVYMSSEALNDEILELAHEEIRNHDPRPFRRLASTNRVLEMGMCGGPVVDKNQLNKVVGTLEGIVPESHPDLPGAAVIIDSRDLRDFLADVTQKVRQYMKNSY